MMIDGIDGSVADVDAAEEEDVVQTDEVVEVGARPFFVARFAARLAAAKMAAWCLDPEGETPFALVALLPRGWRPAAVLVLLLLLAEEATDSDRR